MNKKVLVVVDMQKDFLEPDGKLFLGKDTTEFKKRVAEKIKEYNDCPVFVTLDTHYDDSAEFKQFPKHCIRNTEGWNLSDEIEEALKNNTEEVSRILKISFLGTGIVNRLLRYVRTNYELEFVGVCTHICVHDLIAGLYHETKEQFNCLPNITVNVNLVDDFNQEMAEGALKRMETLYNVKVYKGTNL